MKIINRNKKLVKVNTSSALSVVKLKMLEDNTNLQAYSDIKNYCSLCILQSLNKLDLIKKRNTKTSFIKTLKSLNIADKYQRVVACLVEILLETNYLVSKRNMLQVADDIKKELNQFNPEKRKEELLKKYSNHVEYINLIHESVEKLSLFISGKLVTEEDLVSAYELNKLEEFDRENAQIKYVNQLLFNVLSKSINKSVKQLSEGDKINILQLGDGNQSLIEEVLSKQSSLQDKLELTFTSDNQEEIDSFNKQFELQREYLKATLLNINQSSVEQGFGTGLYDLVIGTNIAANSSNTGKTLSFLKPLLKKNGVIALNEVVDTDIITALIVGLSSKPDLHEDSELRLQTGLGLTKDNWETILNENGFTNIEYIPENSSNTQQLIIAGSNGVITVPQTIQQNKVELAEQNLTSQDVDSNMEWLTDQIINVAADVIKLPKEEFDTQEQFKDYGFDSVMGNTLINQINNALDITLRATDLYSYPNIEQLANYIKETFKDILTDKTPQAQPNKEVTAIIEETATGSKSLRQKAFSTRNIGVENANTATSDIAIIGISGQFGSAKTPDEYWEVLKEGKSLIEELPQDRWKESVSGSAYKKGDKVVKRWGSFLTDIDKFDPLFFKLSGSEAEMMDPQQRLFLEHCWKAIEDAAINPEKLSEQKCGVYVGVAQGEYAGGKLGEMAAAMWGNSNAILASRISYFLNLKGPAISLDTACSSSLVAIDMGCSSLQRGDTDVVLTGGINIFNSLYMYTLLERAGMLSPNGRCYTFDKRADGFVPGEGVGVFMLKRLADAERDGDQIYGVIKGSLTNQDGATNGITAPSVLSQKEIELDVYKKFNINPDTISYIEAHGTGTSLGDPIEFEALTTSFRTYTDKKNFCSLGSSKTNIGHALEAAGSAGLLKILLSLKHQQLPPSANYQECNPLIELTNSPFRIQEKLESWSTNNQKPKRAAISSFGFSGTNAHIVVEEYKPILKTKYISNTPVVVPLSAKNEIQLKEMANNLVNYLENNSTINLWDIAYTLQIGRLAMAERLAIVCTSTVELKNQLQAFIKNNHGNIYSGKVKKSKSLDSVNNALNINNANSVAELWCKGVKIDWNLFYSGSKPNKVSLPTYPFARESYWVEEKQEVTSSNQQFHPLVHTNNSTLNEQIFTSTYLGNEFFLADHQVKEEKILPGAAYLEIAKIVGDKSLEDKVTRLTSIEWLDPITVNGKPKQIHTSLFPTDNGISYEVFSVTDKEEKIHNIGAISTEALPKAEKLNIEVTKSSLNYSKEGKACYNIFKQIGLQYGQTFQGIQKVFYNADKALAYIKLPSSSNSFMLPPGIMDSALQTCNAMSYNNPSLNLSIPFSIGEVLIYKPLPETLWSYATNNQSTKEGSKLNSFNVNIYDESGELCVGIKDFVAISVESVEKPKATLSNELNTYVYQSIWKEQNVDIRQETSEVETLVLLGGCNAEIAERLEQSIEIEVQNVELDNELSLFIKIKEVLKNKLENNKPFKLVLVCENKDYLEFGFVLGLLKTVTQESPQISGKVITVEDLTVSGLDEVTHILETELNTTDVEVRYQNGTREIRTLQQLSSNNNNASTIKEGGVYLITGGAGGLGKIFAENIQKTKGTQLILTGRSTLTSAKQAELASLSVTYIPCDISKQNEVENLIKTIKQKFGKLNGIIHSAGVIRDSLLVNKTTSEITEVLTPKITGIKCLDEASKNEPLDFMVLFSSVAGVMGNVGQGDYASANAYLDNYASHRNELLTEGKRQGKTISINWPLWKSGGMHVDESTEDYMKSNWGLVPLPTDEGLVTFNELIHSFSGQAMILYGTNKIPTLFNHELVETKTQATETAIPEPNSDNKALQEASFNYLRKVLAKELKIADNRIEQDTPFEEYGIDSVLITKLTNRLQEIFDQIPRTLFFECQTLGDLMEYFMSNHVARLTELTGARKTTSAIAKEDTPVQEKTQYQVNAKVSSTRKNKLAKRVVQSSGSSEKFEDIAIIGMSGRYPGAKNLNEFWENLKAGIDSITEIPKERWDIDGFYSPEKGLEGKSYSKWGGFMTDIDKFDPLFFGISPMEAELMDPQERLFLQATWETMEDAGYTKSQLHSSAKDSAGLAGKVGVYAGVMYEEYQLFGAEETLKGNPIALFANPSGIANRVSYSLNLHGPSMAIDTMCSSSLTAIHLACKDIHGGDAELAIAGGVNVSVHPNKYRLLSQGHFASSKGRCESFGEGGEGYVPGEGVGVVLLKKLSKAEADGDRIYGVIKGTAINHGGKTNGYTVPNPKAQSAVITQAMQKADVQASEFSYIEAHGTGTSLGDPIEMAGLSKAFENVTDQKCSIGSVKSNIGHCESAAGISGVTKILLQMKHQQLVPSLHSSTLNPHIDFENSPFKVQQELEEWQGINDKPKIAGISSFGAGGSNAHIIIEEYKPQVKYDFNSNMPAIITLSAKDTERLKEVAENLKSYLLNTTETNIHDIAYTLQLGREAMEERLAIVTTNTDDLITKLDGYLIGKQDDDMFSGNGKKEKMDIFLKGKAGKAYIESALENKESESLAQLWAKGINIDWSLIYTTGKPNKIGLPTYPFAKERYWVNITKEGFKNKANQSQIHPLLHAETQEILHPLLHTKN